MPATTIRFRVLAAAAALLLAGAIACAKPEKGRPTALKADPRAHSAKRVLRTDRGSRTITDRRALFEVPGREPVRMRIRRIAGAEYVSALELLSGLGLEVEYRPARGELNARAGRTPIRIVAGRAAIDYGGRILRLDSKPLRAGDDLLLPRSFLGPLRGALIEGGNAAPAWETRPPARDSALRLVVIDPGHGGEDFGARGPGGLREKDVTLAVGVRLARILRRELGCDVVLTRESDRALSLPERTAIANRAGADLFVSIHGNASPAPSAAGYETFILSATASDAEARRLAEVENAAGGPAAGLPAGFLELTLQDLVRAESLEESARFAALVQRRLGDTMPSENRGVKQAPFWVLAGAEMPAVLVEIGFITNPHESRRLGLPETQERIAESIAHAVDAFRAELDRRRGVTAAR